MLIITKIMKKKLWILGLAALFLTACNAAVSGNSSIPQSSIPEIVSETVSTGAAYSIIDSASSAASSAGSSVFVSSGVSSGSVNSKSAQSKGTIIPSSAVTSSSEKAVSSEGEITESAEEKAIFDAINQQRVNNGLTRLTYNKTLNKCARLKSEDMKALNYFDHNSPTYGSVSQLVQRFDITYRSLGENLHYGARSAQTAVDGWMNSPGHRSNILSGNYTHMGVGVAKKSDGAWISTNIFAGF